MNKGNKLVLLLIGLFIINFIISDNINDDGNTVVFAQETTTAEQIIKDWTSGGIDIQEVKDEFEAGTGIKINDLAYAIIVIKTDFSALLERKLAAKMSGTLETCYNKISNNIPDLKKASQNLESLFKTGNVQDLENLNKAAKELQEISDDHNKAINQEPECKKQTFQDIIERNS